MWDTPSTNPASVHREPRPLMPHRKCAHKHMEGLYLMLWSTSGAAQKWRKAKGSPWAVMGFFCGSFQPVLRSLCSPDQYLVLYHNPPVNLNVNTNMCKYDCSLVSSGLVSFYKCQKSSPPFHEWNRKHWTALLPNKAVCSWENIVLQMPSFKHAFSIHLKVQVVEIRE